MSSSSWIILIYHTYLEQFAMNHTPMNNTPIPSRSTAWLVRIPSYSYYVLVHNPHWTGFFIIPRRTSGKLTLTLLWKISNITIGKSTINGAIFNSYVSLPAGNEPIDNGINGASGTMATRLPLVTSTSLSCAPRHTSKQVTAWDRGGFHRLPHLGIEADGGFDMFRWISASADPRPMELS